jgi:hypothetical protein
MEQTTQFSFSRSMLAKFSNKIVIFIDIFTRSLRKSLLKHQNQWEEASENCCFSRKSHQKSTLTKKLSSLLSLFIKIVLFRDLSLHGEAYKRKSKFCLDPAKVFSCLLNYGVFRRAKSLHEVLLETKIFSLISCYCKN